MKNKELEKYYNKLIIAQQEEIKKKGTPYIGRVENPENVCKTLWIPVYSGNRTATIDLNHELIGFDEYGRLFGANGNCGTIYQIVQIPNEWNEKDIEKLAELVCKKMGKNDDYPKYRVLKSDERMSVILDSIEELKNTSH